MKTKIIVLSLILFSASALARHHKHNHTDGVGDVGDPCEVLTCMTGKLQGDTQPACQSVNQRYFNIRVFTPYYNPEATAQMRRTVALMACSGSVENSDNVEAVTQRYGRSFSE